ncbi:MAG: B-box zinc finger protein [Actinomycetota bacterium]|nr:B-box zinc finger protein [Actinomycetota bacterium]
MSTNEVAVSGRCETHPGRAAVGRCESCGRLLCIGCAVPVRGQILGPECVGEVLGPDLAREAAAPSRQPRQPGLALAGVGFAGALVASALPWSTQFSSHASGLFGGWGFTPLSWSLVAAVAAVIGGAVWAVARWKAGRRETARWALLTMAVLVAAGAVLYLIAPPPFSRPWLGPWVALGAAATAFGGLLWDGRLARRTRSGAP